MDEQIFILIPLNHICTNKVYEKNRFTIFPNSYVRNNKVIQLNNELTINLFHHNFTRIINDFCTLKIPRMEKVDSFSLYNLSYAMLKLNKAEFETRKDVLNLINIFFASLRIFDIDKCNSSTRIHRWSEWQRPYNYSYFSFLYSGTNLIDILEIELNKLSLDVDINNLNSDFDELLEKCIKNVKNEKLIKMVDFYNKIYGLIIDKNFKDANLYGIFLLEYLFCDKKDVVKSKKIIEQLNLLLDKEVFTTMHIDNIITQAYRERSESVHKYKGLTPESLYNFNLYYFHPIEQLLEQNEKNLFEFFIAINKIILLEINNL